MGVVRKTSFHELPVFIFRVGVLVAGMEIFFYGK
jgi:hypothetical protein